MLVLQYARNGWIHQLILRCGNILYFGGKWAYYNIDVSGKYKVKTILFSLLRQFDFFRFLFVLCNAPGCRWKEMNVTLSAVKWKFALVYIDNIVLLSRTQRNTYGCTNCSFSTQTSQSYNEPEERYVFMDKIYYPRYIWRSERLKSASSTTDAIQGLKLKIEALNWRLFSVYTSYARNLFRTLRES